MFGMSESYSVSVVTGVEKYSVAILLNLVVVGRTHNKLSKCQSLVSSFRDTGLPIHTDARYYLR